jgi:AAA domain-containing protein/Toprim domain-containing protein
MSRAMAEEFALSLGGTPKGAGWIARCPAHNDTNPSLDIIAGDKQPIVVTCWAGCTYEQVMAATAARKSTNGTSGTNGNGTPPKPSAVTVAKGPLGEPTVVYPYRQLDGQLAYEACRFEPKDFRPRLPGSTYYGLPKETPRVLYKLYELTKLSDHRACFIVEGEKDVDTLWSHEIAAVTNIGGANAWKLEHGYAKQLKDAGVERVAIIPDADEPGRKHAQQVAADLHEVGLVSRVVELPVKDVTDYLAEYTVDDLKKLVSAAPEWAPAIQRFPDYTDVGYSDLFFGEHEVEELPDYHWDGFVVRGSVVTVLGAMKHTKSWFADLLMVSAAAKEPIFPGFPSGGQRVLLINGPRENSEHESKRRIRAMHRQYGVKPGGGEIRVRSYRLAALRIGDDAIFNDLLAYVDEFKPQAIRIDSAGALWGGKNEGDNTEVRDWMTRRLDVLRAHAAPKCTVYLLAHTGHAIRDGKRTFAQRHQRGASAWGDSTDALLMVEKVKAAEGSPDHHVVSTIGMEYTRLGPETLKKVQLTISGGPGTGEQLGMELSEAVPEMVSIEPSDTETALRVAVGIFQRETKVAQSEAYKQLAAAGITTNVGREALRVLRGTRAWPAGQYKGTVRSMVREDGKRNHSPLLVWIGHSGDIWQGEPETPSWRQAGGEPIEPGSDDEGAPF